VISVIEYAAWVSNFLKIASDEAYCPGECMKGDTGKVSVSLAPFCGGGIIVFREGF